MSLGEVAMHASDQVLLEVDDNNVPNVGNQQGILSQLSWPLPINLLNIILVNIN